MIHRYWLAVAFAAGIVATLAVVYVLLFKATHFGG